MGIDDQVEVAEIKTDNQNWAIRTIKSAVGRVRGKSPNTLLTSEAIQNPDETEQSRTIRQKVNEIEDMGLRISAVIGVTSDNVAQIVDMAYELPDDDFYVAVDNCVNYKPDIFTLVPDRGSTLSEHDIALKEKFHQKSDFVMRLSHLGNAITPSKTAALINEAMEVPDSTVSEIQRIYQEYNRSVSEIESKHATPAQAIESHIKTRQARRKR